MVVLSEKMSYFLLSSELETLVEDHPKVLF